MPVSRISTPSALTALGYAPPVLTSAVVSAELSIANTAKPVPMALSAELASISGESIAFKWSCPFIAVMRATVGRLRPLVSRTKASDRVLLVVGVWRSTPADGVVATRLLHNIGSGAVEEGGRNKMLDDGDLSKLFARYLFLRILFIFL